MFHWLKVLMALDDNQLKEICGTDYALYLVFLRMTAKLLLGITLFNSIIMVPIYMTGEPMASDDYRLIETMSSMNQATVLNITATHPKMIFAYICAIILIPAFALFMVYSFRKKYYSWKKKIDPMTPF